MHSTSVESTTTQTIATTTMMGVESTVTTVVIGKSPSTSVINHSWFSSLKRPLKKKFFSGKSHSKDASVRAEFANQHQYYSWNSRKSKSTWDISNATSTMVSKK